MESYRNGAWPPHLERIDRINEGYCQWRRNLEMAKREGARPSRKGGSPELRGLRRLFSWLKKFLMGK
jgi:hypothetical protein